MTSSEIITIISILATAATAILSVIAQCWSAVVNARSARLIAELEIYQPRLCDALEGFSAAYSKLSRYNTSACNPDSDAVTDAPAIAYQDLMAAAYQVMALVPDTEIHRDISAMMDDLADVQFRAYPKTDAAYRAIAARLALYISASKPKSRKPKKQKNKDSKSSTAL